MMKLLLTCIGSCAFASSLVAQLVPSRLYFGFGTPAPVSVVRPAGLEGELSVELRLPDGSVLERATVDTGAVNFATIFAKTWADPMPRLVYAQLVAGGTRIGSPLVLQPLKGTGPAQMTNPTSGEGLVVSEKERTPNFLTRDAKIGYAQGDKLSSGFRAYVEKRVVLETTMGELEFELRPDAAPNTAFNFLHLVEGGFYTDVMFHRVVAKLPNGHAFVIQTGDPTGTGDGGPGYAIDLEPSVLPHDFGVLSMARDDDPDTNGSQIFVALSREGTQRLDGKYTAFGKLVRGEEVVRAIAAVPVAGENHRPVDPPRIIRARTLDAPSR